MKINLAPLAAATILVGTSFQSSADEWAINGYGMTNYRLVDGASSSNEFGKPDYLTAGTSQRSANQAELTVKKHDEYENDIYADYVLRAEYGNGEHRFRSSSGSEDNDDNGPFEVKEAYVLLGNLPYFNNNSQVWAGRRYLNRASGLLSNEYWKQSSGVGAGYEVGLEDNRRIGFAVISADPADSESDDKNTLTSTDFYYYGVKALGGSFDFDLKFSDQANTSLDGVGGSITYNRDYYGLDGWSQTVLAYGEGSNTNRGVNFGQWSSAGFNEDSSGLFFTSYGVANLSDKLQLGSELTYFKVENAWGQDEVERQLIAVRPSYKVDDNLRLEFTASLGSEALSSPSAWGLTKDKTYFQTYEFATVFTVNADYFGRPQIKPYVTHYVADDGADNRIGLTDGRGSETIFGIQAEIWF